MNAPNPKKSQTIYSKNEFKYAFSLNNIHLFFFVAGAVKYTLRGHSSWITSLAVLSNGDLASGSFDASIKIWDTSNGTLKSTLTGHASTVYALVALPNGDLASGSYDQTIKVWSLTNNNVFYTLLGHTNLILSLIHI